MTPPFDRPGSGGERTIVVPNPAGRRPAAGGATPFGRAAEAERAAPPAAVPDWARPQPPAEPTPEAWAMPVSPPRPVEPARAPQARRDLIVAPNQNPYLQAGGPLLLLFGRLQVQLSRASFSALMDQVAGAVEDFEREARAAGAPAHQTELAKYILCATADDVVQNIPTEERRVFTQHPMLSRFFQDLTGGVRFFTELEKAKVDPVGNYDLLELMHACLAMGFQGVHRTSPGGMATLQQIQRGLYELLRRVRPASREISPRWQGSPIAPITAQATVPLWAMGSAVALLLGGCFLALRFLLAGSTETAASALVSVHPQTEIGIQRRIYAAPKPQPPPPPPAVPSPAGPLQAALQDDIAAKRLVVVETGNQIVIRIAAAMFAPGDARVKPEFKLLVERLGKLLQSRQGQIRVVGHTDAAQIRTVRFPSNFHLSQERARAVGQILKAALGAPNRVEIEGKGADQPIASNDTAEGRARNRRVEILVPRGG